MSKNFGGPGSFHERAMMLIGHWVIDPDDHGAVAAFGRVSMTFDSKGSLTYVIHHGDRDEIMLLTYRVEGDEIVSDQPTDQGQERTRFRVTDDGRLILEFGGVVATFRRRGW